MSSHAPPYSFFHSGLPFTRGTEGLLVFALRRHQRRILHPLEFTGDRFHRVLDAKDEILRLPGALGPARAVFPHRRQPPFEGVEQPG